MPAPLPLPLPVEEEKTEFDVVLKEVGANKIAVIKGGPRRHRPGPEGSLGDRGQRPQGSERGISKEDAEKLAEELKGAGAVAEVKKTL